MNILISLMGAVFIGFYEIIKGNKNIFINIFVLCIPIWAVFPSLLLATKFSTQFYRIDPLIPIVFLAVLTIFLGMIPVLKSEKTHWAIKASFAIAYAILSAIWYFFSGWALIDVVNRYV